MLKRVADRRLSAGVDEEVAGRERHVRAARKPRLTENLINDFRNRQKCRRWRLNHQSAICRTLYSLGQQFENAITHVDLLVQTAALGKRPEDAIQDRVYVLREDVVGVDRIKWRLLDA